jgi:hypothetical protein
MAGVLDLFHGLNAGGKFLLNAWALLPLRPRVSADRGSIEYVSVGHDHDWLEFFDGPEEAFEGGSADARPEVGVREDKDDAFGYAAVVSGFDKVKFGLNVWNARLNGN